MDFRRCQDTSDPRHFGPKSLRHYCDGAEVSGHFGTGAEVSNGHFGTTSTTSTSRCGRLRSGCLVSRKGSPAGSCAARLCVSLLPGCLAQHTSSRTAVRIHVRRARQPCVSQQTIAHTTPKTLRYRSVLRTLRHQCRSVLRTLRHQCRSVLGPKCLGSEVS